MKKIVLYILCLMPLILYSTIWHVNQDGTGDFVSIQAAVNNANNDDTILIHEGVYYEHVQTSNKPLTYASLFYLDSDESHIGNTILDGQHSHPLMTHDNDVFGSNISIIGLTFRNGNREEATDTYCGGGAIGVQRATLTLNDCSIYNNYGIIGGGVFTRNCQVFLAGNSIRNNRAFTAGGGVSFIFNGGDSYPVIFDGINLNSFYSNLCWFGTDMNLYQINEEHISEIVADTLSVAEYDNYCNVVKIRLGSTHSNLPVNANTETLPRVESNLYVAPWGDDNNDGLTSFSPFKSIMQACMIISPRVDSTLIIYLLPGEYNNSNQRCLPVNVRDNTIISGESPETTIINCDQMTSAFINRVGSCNFEIENLSIINCSVGADNYYSSISLNTSQYPSKVKIRNSKFYNDYMYQSTEAQFYVNVVGVTLDICDTEFGNENLEALIPQKSVFCNEDYFSQDFNSISNCTFYGQNETICFSSQFNSNLLISNCLFDYSQTYNYEADPFLVRYGIAIEGKVDANIINNTFYGNHPAGQLDGLITIIYSNYDTGGNNVNVKNNIMIDNFTPTSNNSVYVDNHYGPWATNVNVGNNLVLGGESTVGYPNWEEVTFNYEDTNIDTIPHFTGYGVNRFMLDDDSPCIDEGTLNLPDGFEQPETDLVGNPRVHGESIDMGCYEWQGNVADFTMQAMGNVFPIDVVFTPHYNFPIDTIAWDLDLDGVIDSYEMNPVWSYPDFSGHNVGMYINDGEAIEIKYDCIQPTTPILEETNDTPEANELLACYPNPVRISTGNVILKYNVKDVGNAELKVYNIKGQMVKSIKVKSQRKGRNTIFWYLTDNRGVHVSSGVYLYNLEQNGESIGKGQITVVK